MQQYADRALKWSFDDPAELQRARTNYVALFLDVDRLHRFVAKYVPWWSNRTDDDHLETVTITCANGSPIVATTESQVSYGVPWVVRDGDATTTTYNTDIGRQLAALLGELDINHSRYGDDYVAFEYASSVLSDYVKKYGMPDAFDRLPAFKATLGAAGFKHEQDRLFGRPHGWDYIVESPDQPGFQLYGVAPRGAGADEARAMVASAHAMFAQLRRYPWLRAALRVPNQKGYATPPASYGFYDLAKDSSDLRKAGLVAAADLLDANSFSEIEIEFMRDVPTDSMSDESEWYLLPDGRLLLVRFATGGLTALGLDEAKLTWPEDARSSLGGEVFSPDGTWRVP